MTNNKIITIPHIKEMYDCTERTALRKLKKARIALGKAPNVDGKKGAEPVTVEQFCYVFGLELKKEVK